MSRPEALYLPCLTCFPCIGQFEMLEPCKKIACIHWLFAVFSIEAMIFEVRNEFLIFQRMMDRLFWILPFLCVIRRTWWFPFGPWKNKLFILMLFLGKLWTVNSNLKQRTAVWSNLSSRDAWQFGGYEGSSGGLGESRTSPKLTFTWKNHRFSKRFRASRVYGNSILGLDTVSTWT